MAHGDIQPANVIVSSHTSRQVLIDFGSAWTTQTAAFREEGDGHHRCYAAPDLQSGGRTCGFFSDQFSVSVILYELLTGEIPDGGLGGSAGRPEFVAAADQSPVPPSQLSRTCGGLPRSLRHTLDEITLLAAHDRGTNPQPGGQGHLRFQRPGAAQRVAARSDHPHGHPLRGHRPDVRH